MMIMVRDTTVADVQRDELTDQTAGGDEHRDGPSEHAARRRAAPIAKTTAPDDQVHQPHQYTLP